MRITLGAVVTTFLLMAGCGDEGTTKTDGRVLDRPGLHVKYPVVDGFNRSYWLYIPESL